MIDHFNSSNASYLYFAPFINKVTFTVVYCLLFVISIIGNSLIVWIVFKDRRLKTTTNFLVANMAVSDLMAAVFGFPFLIFNKYFDGRWLIGGGFGNILCKTSGYLIELSFPVSVYSCVFIAIDRYYAVAHPMKKLLRKVKYIIVGIWITSGLINTGYLYWMRTLQYEEFLRCSYIVNSIYYSYYRHIILVLAAGLPALVVTIIYTLIVYKVRKRKAPGQQTGISIRRREQQNRKVLKMSVTIVGLLYLSFGFWLTVQFLFSSGKLHNMSPLAKFNFYYVSFVMLYMSLVYNFFIYLIFNNIYRENIKTIMAKCCCTFV